MRARNRPTIRQVAEYGGERTVAIEATQLDVSQSNATRIVREWCDFFASGPSPMVDIEFVSRTPKRLFASLRGQPQLQRLELKWGDYDDLSALIPMQHLADLRLGNAVGLTDLRPLASLQDLRRLELEGTKRVRDYSPIGELVGLEHLIVVESLWGPRLHADSLGWITSLKALQKLTWSPLVDDLDYAAVLELGHVGHIQITAHKYMTPSHADLEWALPGMQKAQRENAEHVVPYLDTDGSTLGEFRMDIDGKIRFHPTSE